MKYVNDTYGHGVGDSLIKAMADNISTVFCDAKGVYRTGGDEFIVIVVNKSREDIQIKLEELEAKGKEKIIIDNIRLDYAIGMARYDANKHNHLGDMVKEADNNMYKNKRNIKTKGDRKSVV